jgi:phosphomannomutase
MRPEASHVEPAGRVAIAAPRPGRGRIRPDAIRAYDIRGVVGRDIDETFAEHLGRAFGTEALALGEKAVAVGRDGRISGPALAQALIRGLASTGLDVVDLGPVTTPMLYYVAGDLRR